MNRVLVPADTVNGITVGAAGSPTGTTGASYSARGPGRTAAQILPTGIAFGGSEAEPFIAVDNDGTPLRFKGTSCAAPLVVHGLARAATRLGLDYRTSTLLRCCVVHFAEAPRGQQHDHVGYGHLPSDYPEIDYSESHIVHVLYEGQTVRGEVDVLALPMPEGMPVPVGVRITLVSASEVNASDAGDYVGAGLEAAFRPDATVYKYTSPTEQTKELSVIRDADEIAQLVAEGWKPAGAPMTRSWTVKSKTEASRRASGKWGVCTGNRAPVHQGRTGATPDRVGTLLPGARDDDQRYHTAEVVHACHPRMPTWNRSLSGCAGPVSDAPTACHRY